MRPLILAFLVAMSAAGCDNPLKPTTTGDGEDWSYPPDTAKVAVTPISPDTVAVGESFDVVYVLYNMPALFGAAADLPYERDRIVVERVLVGPVLGKSDATLSVAFVDTTRGVVQVASTVRAGSAVAPTTTGVLCKLRCHALRTGRTRFRIDAVDLKTSTGANVTASVRREESRTEIVR